MRPAWALGGEDVGSGPAICKEISLQSVGQAALAIIELKDPRRYQSAVDLMARTIAPAHRRPGRGREAADRLSCPGGQGLQCPADLVEPAAAVLIGRADLDDLDRLVDEGFFADAFRTDDTEKA